MTRPAARSRPSRSPRGGRAARPDHDALGGAQVEGRRAVWELLRAGRRPVLDVWVTDGEGPGLGDLIELARSCGVPVRHVPPARLEAEARTTAPQGVLAHARPLVPVALGDLCLVRPPPVPRPFLVALDGVTDPQNLGAVLRTAEVAGATGAVLPRRRAAHVTPAAAKAAAGAIEHVPMALVAGLPAALAAMRDEGVWTVGLDAGAPRSLFGLEIVTEPVALVLGAEGAGLSRLARARCDVVVGIPQAGALGSLNVAAAAAVACFEVARARAGT